jgi:hypothetical protein
MCTASYVFGPRHGDLATVAAPPPPQRQTLARAIAGELFYDVGILTMQLLFVAIITHEKVADYMADEMASPEFITTVVVHVGFAAIVLLLRCCA